MHFKYVAVQVMWRTHLTLQVFKKELRSRHSDCVETHTVTRYGIYRIYKGEFSVACSLFPRHRKYLTT
jgi:hypothetical protein